MRLHRAVGVLLRAWRGGRSHYGAPPVGSTVYEGLRDLEIADTEGDWIGVRDWVPKPSTLDSEDYGAWVNSDRVLAWDGRAVWVAYVQHWRGDDEPEPYRWVSAGRDGYGIEGITHWQPLPEVPS